VALHVIVFVFLFIFLRIFSEYHFYCVEQNQLFQLTPIFIIDKLMQPGGLAMVLSGCLVQFFILPNVGAMITAALLTGLGALFWAILRRIDPRSHGILWAWLPVLSLLFVQWDFNYRFQGTVAFGMMLLALYLVLSMRNKLPYPAPNGNNNNYPVKRQSDILRSPSNAHIIHPLSSGKASIYMANRNHTA